ncbi:MAG: peroxidase-related enzyme [Steroidobacteraceae bacterium]
MQQDERSPRWVPEGAELSDLFRAYPVGVRELLVYHDRVLRHPAPLTVAERELIAAVVSGINACGYCYGAHRVIAESFGVEESVILSVLEDPRMALAPARLQPILRLVDKLTRDPSSIRQSDRDAIFAAGWSEEALFYAVLTCALFNLMNRIVEGMGITSSPEILTRQRARHERSPHDPVKLDAYEDYGRKLGLFGSTC